MAGKEFEDFLLRFRKMPKPVRVVYARPRTFLSIAIGIAAFFFLPGSLRLVTRLLISWDIFIALYLLLVYGMVLRSDQLTLSGGDLEKPVTLKRVGPPTPRPDSLVVPKAPPASERAWE